MIGSRGRNAHIAREIGVVKGNRIDLIVSLQFGKSAAHNDGVDRDGWQTNACKGSTPAHHHQSTAPGYEVGLVCPVRMCVVALRKRPRTVDANASRLSCAQLRPRCFKIRRLCLRILVTCATEEVVRRKSRSGWTGYPPNEPGPARSFVITVIPAS